MNKQMHPDINLPSEEKDRQLAEGLVLDHQKRIAPDAVSCNMHAALQKISRRFSFDDNGGGYHGL